MCKAKNVFAIIFLAGLIMFFSGASSFGSEKTGAYTQEQLDYTGQDESRTPSSLNLLYTRKDLPDGSDANIYTLRGIYRSGLAPDWDMLLRLNVPLQNNDTFSDDNTQGHWEFGLGDISTRAVFTKKLDEISALIFGVDLSFPTAVDDQFGSGKYAMTLGTGYRHFFRGISGKANDTFILPNIRYAFDYAGDDDRADISEVQLVPQVTFGLPGSLDHFVTFYGGDDLRYNFDTSKWFVPLDITYGMKLTKKSVLSFEYCYELVDDYPLYDWKIEIALEYFF
jgi:hypothetical protein